MKRNIIIATVMVILMIWLPACTNSGTRDKSKGSTSNAVEKIEYTCPMHPEIISDIPGQCPKCGMDLVKHDMTADTVHGMTIDSMEAKK